MTEREKVIKELQGLSGSETTMKLIADAIALLEEQEEQEEQIKHLSALLRRYEPVKPHKSRKNIKYPYSCGNCACYLQPTWRACPMCGSKVKWK